MLAKMYYNGAWVKVLLRDPANSHTPYIPKDPNGGSSRPVVPQTGTWQLKTTTTKKYVILGTDDDNAGNARFYRLLRTFGFPYTMNMEAENINRSINSDVDTSAFSDSDAPSLFPTNTTTKQLALTIHSREDGEVAQHGSSDSFIADSNKVTGDALTNIYADYTAGGGTKTQEEFVVALKAAIADRDVAQGCPYVARCRGELEDALGFYINSVGIWGTTSTFTVDGVALNSSYISWGSYDWRGHDYVAVGARLDSGGTSLNIHNLIRYAGGMSSSMAEVNAIPIGHCGEFFWHSPMLTDDGSSFRTTFTALKALVDNGTVAVVTREQYASLGEYVDNPVVSISLSRNGNITRGTTDSDSAYTVTATFADNTTQNVSSGSVIFRSGVDTSTCGRYTVSATYKGFNTSASVAVVSEGFTYPEGLKSQNYWFVYRNTTKDCLVAGNITSTITEFTSYDAGFATTAPTMKCTTGSFNFWSSTDEGATWTKVVDGETVYSKKNLYTYDCSANGDRYSVIEDSENFTRKYFV